MLSELYRRCRVGASRNFRATELTVGYESENSEKRPPLSVHHQRIECAFRDVAAVDHLIEFVMSGNQRAEERAAVLATIKTAGEVEQAAALRRRSHPPQRH